MGAFVDRHAERYAAKHNRGAIPRDAQVDRPDPQAEAERRAYCYAATNHAIPPAAPVPLDKPREPSGRYAPPSDLCAVVPVMLTNGRVGWRVGPGGQIFDVREHALRRAARRLAFYQNGK